MHRRDQEQIVALRLPNTGLKVSSSSSRVMLCFGYCYSVLAIRTITIGYCLGIVWPYSVLEIVK